jgi:hypothetical protein
MGPAVPDPGIGGPFAMLNKNIEKDSRKFVAADADSLGNPLNMQFCYERSCQRMHSICAQTKLAVQEFNCCSTRGWVPRMLVHIPSPSNPVQVVWCLVWHMLRCILPPMPMFLPAEFSYRDYVRVDDPTRNDDFYTVLAGQDEL